MSSERENSLRRWDLAVANSEPPLIAAAAREMLALLWEADCGHKANAILARHFHTETDAGRLNSEEQKGTRPEPQLHPSPAIRNEQVQAQNPAYSSDQHTPTVSRPVSEIENQHAHLQSIVHALQSSVSELQLQAASSLAALARDASGRPEQSVVLAGHGVIPVCVQLLINEQSSNAVREQVMQVLGTIAGNSAELRDVVLQNDALSPTLAMISTSSSSQRLPMLRTSTWLLSNLLGGTPSPTSNAAIAAIPTLREQIVSGTDVEVLKHSLWGLVHAVGGRSWEDFERGNLDSKVWDELLPRVVGLLGHPPPAVQAPCIRLVGTIAQVQSPYNFQERLVEHGVLGPFQELIDDAPADLQGEVCRAMSSFELALLLETEWMVPALVEQAEVADEAAVRAEAVRALSVLVVAGTPAQVHQLVRSDCLVGHAKVLEWEGAEAEVRRSALRGIEGVLRAGETLEAEAGEAGRRETVFHAYVKHLELAARVQPLSAHADPRTAELAAAILRAL